MRLIDADALREHMYHEAFETDSGLQKWDSGLWIRYQMFESVLNTEITVEAEPIVRCKDCKFYDPLDANRPYDCLYMDSIFGDDYCSRGEKLPEPIIYPQVEGITPTVVKIDEVTE